MVKPLDPRMKQPTSAANQAAADEQFDMSAYHFERLRKKAPTTSTTPVPSVRKALFGSSDDSLAHMQNKPAPMMHEAGYGPYELCPEGATPTSGHIEDNMGFCHHCSKQLFNDKHTRHADDTGAATATPVELTLEGPAREPYMQAVFDMMRLSYAKIGYNMTEPTELLESDVWEVYTSNDVPIAYSLAKRTKFGLKTISSGTNGSPEGKAVLKSGIAKRFDKAGRYAEVSHAMDRLMAHAPYVPIHEVSRVLGKDITPVDDKKYTREIKGIGPTTKRMVGRPYGVTSLDAKTNEPIAEDIDLSKRTAATTAPIAITDADMDDKHDLWAHLSCLAHDDLDE